MNELVFGNLSSFELVGTGNGSVLRVRLQNLRDLRKRVRSRKTSEKLDQKTKETREERPRDGAGGAERGEGGGRPGEGRGGGPKGPRRRFAPTGTPPLPSPGLPRPVPRALISCLLFLLIKVFGRFPLTNSVSKISQVLIWLDPAWRRRKLPRFSQIMLRSYNVRGGDENKCRARSQISKINVLTVSGISGG